MAYSVLLVPELHAKDKLKSFESPCSYRNIDADFCTINSSLSLSSPSNCTRHERPNPSMLQDGVHGKRPTPCRPQAHSLILALRSSCKKETLLTLKYRAIKALDSDISVRVEVGFSGLTDADLRKFSG